MIKAIETRYKGYRFRSRLEARWAVFFDACGIEWIYEPEGFELGDAGRYLPDFLLPVWNCWFEVKGSSDLSEREVRVATELSRQSAKNVYTACGNIGAPFFKEGDVAPQGPKIRLTGPVLHCGKSRIPLGHAEYKDNEDIVHFEASRLTAFTEYPDGSLDLNTMTTRDFATSDGEAILAVHSQFYQPVGASRPRIIPGIIDSSGRASRSARLCRAYDAARSARFEHGEVAA